MTPNKSIIWGTKPTRFFTSRSLDSLMDEKNNALEQYEKYRKDMQDGILTEKGFHSKVKNLLCELPSTSAMSKCKDAAEIFAQMKRAQQQNKVTKKKLFPMVKSKESFLKIKIVPMSWKSRTKSKPGRFHKIILEEAPPRALMRPSDNYDDIIEMAIKQFWSTTEQSNVTYTLCYSDGSRWPKEDFNKEYGTLGNIPEIWKKTFYVGQRLMDDEVVYVGTLDSVCGSPRHPLEDDDLTQEINNLSDLSSGFLEASIARSSKRKNNQESSYESLLQNFDLNSMENPGKQQKSDQVDCAATPPAPLNQMEYMPRVPYVEANQIKYNTDMVIGTGSFGSVYIGSYQGTPSAIKKIPVNQETRDIMHEIIVCLRLSHPNIVRFMAAAKTDTFVLIANEYIHGASLHTVLHGRESSVKLDSDDKNYVALEISMAVEYIHSKNIIHQDLKPANIIIEETKKKAYLTDWGMANIRDTVQLKRGSRLTQGFTGPIGGTAVYMSPECLLRYESCTQLSDMWSLGMTFLELFTNMSPWTAKTCQELRNFMSKELIPHAMHHLAEQYLPIIGCCVKYQAESWLTASALVNSLKSADFINLKNHYGFQW